MQRRNFLRTVCGSVIAAVMVPVAKLFPSSGLVHVPSEDAFTEGLWKFRQKKHEDDRAILDQLSASLSGSPIRMSPQLLEDARVNTFLDSETCPDCGRNLAALGEYSDYVHYIPGTQCPCFPPLEKMTLGEMVKDVRGFADFIEQQISLGQMPADTPMGEHKQWNWKRRIVLEVKPATPANENEAAEYIA